MKNEQLNQLVYEALETELGGVQVYETAIRCAVNDDLQEEWKEYLEQTQNHVEIVQGLSESVELVLNPRPDFLEGELITAS